MGVWITLFNDPFALLKKASKYRGFISIKMSLQKFIPSIFTYELFAYSDQMHIAIMISK
ncbi:hypothetical protein VCHA35P150_20411 [Vibrio chagasii]|nr:hypothetical protein VCHA35P150_20411 [Vibrio chagasii]